ncbi:MAG TPA: FAD-dependent oxidoreductase [Geminicoccus sp.]|jgi:hypothetical protein|uniref:NAD(P)/FAD-dependent oxidoreductase n=1 Tax=Geminicoccus sp. TaxID=2024832 RepID=UPI002E332379|nr:FAD-dependent oxidoreductase [Geminicoccus sp.]HEX2526816.1 FAD-dependent oxidoreductase [Geminicoccus sp.]
MVQIAVIGAGTAGAACARSLADAGLMPTVFDQGRYPGGRLAHLSVEDASFDVGAQYFTVQHPDFRRIAQQWVAEGRAAVWEAVSSDPVPRARHVGVPGMDALAATQLQGLSVCSGQCVEEIKRSGHLWQLCAAGRSLGRFDAVVTCVPAPDAQRLLAFHPMHDLMDRVRLDPCWSAMAIFADRVPVDFDVTEPGDGPIVFAARNNSKPGRQAAEAWTIHARAAFSAIHRTRGTTEVADLLLDEFALLIGRRPPPVCWKHAHFWPHSKVARPMHEPCLRDPELKLFAAGDWCIGARVEAAWLSGRAAATELLNAI